VPSRSPRDGTAPRTPRQNDDPAFRLSRFGPPRTTTTGGNAEPAWRRHPNGSGPARLNLRAAAIVRAAPIKKHRAQSERVTRFATIDPYPLRTDPSKQWRNEDQRAEAVGELHAGAREGLRQREQNHVALDDGRDAEGKRGAADGDLCHAAKLCQRAATSKTRSRPAVAANRAPHSSCAELSISPWGMRTNHISYCGTR